MTIAKKPVMIFRGGLKKMELSSVYNPNFPKRPHTVKLEYSTLEQRDAMKEWCGQMFGAHTDTWNNPRWRIDSQNAWWFHFKNEGDAALFVMRWS